ncbi:glycosyltransferase [Ectobacillus panaciterrae]|uniref:glycosyltransferase n=1 Tax=Ectobacillus panaciterrae TaxID=363872 RepID=UPI0003FD78B0|nr:glycosyltransferase [Ectobacillus panaciterrae]
MANVNEKLKTSWMYAKKVFSYIQQQGLSTTVGKIQKRMQTKMSLMKGGQETDPRLKEIYESLLTAYQSGAIKGIAIISSGMEFDELYNQRTINFAKYLAEREYGVLYVTWQYDIAEQHEKSFQYAYQNLYQVPMYPYLYSLEELAMFDSIEKKLFISTFPAKAFYTTLPALKQHGFKVIYDIMDEWEEFFKTGDASWYQRSAEEAFVRDADVVSAVSVPLQKKFAHIRADIVISGNGYNEKISKHANIANKTKGADGKIHVGYFGHMTPSWFDWNLVFHLAEQDDIVVHLIGHGATEDILKKVEEQPNMHFYGKVHPGELHTYARQWHIGLIPFKKSKLSEAVDPIKIYEYLYFGLPTISTGIPHIGAYPCVYHCETAQEAKQRIYEIYEHLDETYTPELQHFLETTTWDKQFEKVEDALNKA